MVAAGPFDTVLFDLDGTLTDPRVGITRAVQRGLAEVGIDVEDADSLVAYIGPPLHDSFAEHHGVAVAEVDLAVAAYRRYYTEVGVYENELHAGVPELLDGLVADGVRLAVATSKPDTMAAVILEHFAIDGPFAVVGGATLDGTRRAKADVVEHTLAELAALGSPVDRTRAVLVGDREHDVVGARATGLASIGVTWGYARPGELEAAGADRIVSSVAELATALRGG